MPFQDTSIAAAWLAPWVAMGSSPLSRYPMLAVKGADRAFSPRLQQLCALMLQNLFDQHAQHDTTLHHSSCQAVSHCLRLLVTQEISYTSRPSARGYLTAAAPVEP